MAGWWKDGECVGVVWESCWVDKMVRTRVHARGGGMGIEVWDDCAYGVSGALGAWGLGGFGTLRGG